MPEIKKANNNANSVESILNIPFVKIVKSITFATKDIINKFKARDDNMSNLLTLNLDAESKTTTTKTNMLMDVKITNGKFIIVILLNTIPTSINKGI